jgi:hypothetical protein
METSTAASTTVMTSERLTEPVRPKSSRVVILLSTLLFLAVAAAAWGWLQASDLSNQLKSLQDKQRNTANDLDSARNQLVSTQDALNTVQGEAAALRNQLAEITKELADRSQVPFTIKMRQALTGSGLVATFTNISSKTLTVAAQFYNPTLNKALERRLILRPLQSAEIGYAQGWPFASGDRIVLKSDGYETLIKFVP